MIIGIDPGATGAIAILDGVNADVYDLPTAKIGGSVQISPQRLRSMLVGFGAVDRVFIEDVHANTMSYKGNFTLGLALGIIHGVCAALDRPVERLQPKYWQQAVGVSNIPKAQRKDAHRQLAMELWPHLYDHLKLVKHHNRADALLIAEAGRRNYVTAR